MKRAAVQGAVAGALTLILLAAGYFFWIRDDAPDQTVAEPLPANVCELAGEAYLTTIVPAAEFNHATDHSASLSSGHCRATNVRLGKSVIVDVSRSGSAGDLAPEQLVEKDFARLCREYGGTWQQPATAPPVPEPDLGDQVCGTSGAGELIVRAGDVIVQVKFGLWPEEEAAQATKVAEELARRTLDRLGSR